MFSKSASTSLVVPATQRRSTPTTSPRDVGSTESKQSKSSNRRISLRPNMQSIIERGKAFLTPAGSNQSRRRNGFTTVKEASLLFPPVDPTVDGEDCLHDCTSCTIDLPRKWSIDEDDKLFGHVKGWESHIIVATGKTDWVRDITDEKGSLMEAIGQVMSNTKLMERVSRKVMLSASDMPVSHEHDNDNHNEQHQYPKKGRTRCLVLPSWKFVEGINTDRVEWMMEEVVGKSSSNVQMVKREEVVRPDGKNPNTDQEALHISASQNEVSNGIPKPALSLPPAPPPGISMRSCPHHAVILMCSHKTRDWRCGTSAPLLRKEFERHLRPLGLYRDIHDERPGGVGIYFINHVGGHKYSANVMIYRREGRSSQTGDSTKTTINDEAVQGIWLARVRPEDCENIVKYTVLQGKLVKAQRQLRGGFDREMGLVSW